MGNKKSGIYLTGPGINNLTSNTVTGNAYPGSLPGSSSGNIIYNNYFNNINNTNNMSVDEAAGTIWNITPVPGINIVNGPYLGGNYWANPDGTGWSQVTPDRGDGFCSAPFVINTDNTDYLPLHTYIKPLLYADISVSQTTGAAPLTVKCTDKSIGDPDRYMHNFGDGVNLSGPNPVHTYRFPGVYTITLTIMKYNTTTNSMMSSSMKKTNGITVNSIPFISPVAKFAASPVTGNAQLTVSFTDQSTGSPTHWNYNFGDGINSTSKNPVHTYRFPGVYTVTLTVLKPDVRRGLVISNASVQKDFIVVNRY